jgi:hypothetical protein
MQLSLEEVELRALDSVVIVISCATAGSIKANKVNGRNVNKTYLRGEKNVLLFKWTITTIYHSR